MTGNPEAPEGGRAPADGPTVPAADRTERPRSGPVTELALVAAGLGLVVYFLAFVDDVGPTSSPIVPLLLGGGLLAGSVAVPTVSVRMLAPAAVLAVTGALLLLHAVVTGRNSAIVVGGLVLALLEAGAAVGAVLLHAGVVHARRPKPAPTAAGTPQQAGYPGFPGQQYPGQPYPGSYPGHPGEPYPGDQYAGEHAYAQHARYGEQYGVPGYPPPPPYGSPGYDPAGAHPTAYAAAPAHGPAGEQPTTVTDAEGYRPGAPVSPASGVPASGAAGPGATAVQGSGTFRPASAYPASSGSGTSASGAPAKSTGSHAAPDPADEPGGGEDDRTRAIPTVKDDR